MFCSTDPDVTGPRLHRETEAAMSGPFSGVVTGEPGCRVPLSQSVTHYLVKAVPTARPEETAAAVRERLTGHRYDDASHVFVIAPDGRLLGTVAMADLIGANAAGTIDSLMTSDKCPVVAADTDREQAASIAIRSRGSALAVCDKDGHFVGAVPASALMSILRDEHLEDLHHMVGILGKSEAAKAALTAPPHRRALYRLPWLLVGMAGSALATAMMARFESALAAHIAVAFFVPGIVYLADAVGTQSEVVTVRSLSLTDGKLFQMFSGELATSMLIGATLGALACPLVWLAFGSAALAVTVAVALMVASIVATAVGILLPWLSAKLGYDPALASGPIATVFQDMLSLLTYFLTASVLVF
jgi:magnesium transporter